MSGTRLPRSNVERCLEARSLSRTCNPNRSLAPIHDLIVNSMGTSRQSPEFAACRVVDSGRTVADGRFVVGPNQPLFIPHWKFSTSMSSESD
jgi:hypothetical protein